MKSVSRLKQPIISLVQSADDCDGVRWTGVLRPILSNVILVVGQRS
jgi:hypothetical protein